MSTDRTMLARFGFADPDRKVPEHDAACQYLAQPDVALKVASIAGLGPRPASKPVSRGHSTYVIDDAPCMTYTVGERFDFHHARLELAIQKGSGQYATTIGFVDTVLYFNEAVRSVHTQVRSTGYQPCDGKDDTWTDQHVLACEVKITRLPVGDLLRQLHLYAEYARPQYSHEPTFRWLAALRWQPSEVERRALENERIAVVTLGAGFDAFLATLRTPPTPVDSI